MVATILNWSVDVSSKTPVGTWLKFVFLLMTPSKPIKPPVIFFPSCNELFQLGHIPITLKPLIIFSAVFVNVGHIVGRSNPIISVQNPLGVDDKLLKIIPEFLFAIKKSVVEAL